MTIKGAAAAATFIAVGLGATSIGGAVDTTGDNLMLNGSDTLFDVTQEVLLNCPLAVNDGISYVGGGSGVGAAAMAANAQQVSPMSRALKNTEYCGLSIDTDGDGVLDTAVQGTTEGLLVGLDGIAVVANATNACATGVATGGTLLVNDTNGNPVLNCPGCAAGTNGYTFTSSLDVLRLVYGGMHHDNTTFDCNGNVRRSLVKNWIALFSAGCTTNNCPGGLTHAWRRSDLSGTTDAFVSLVGFGARGIGTLSTVPNASQKVNNFCNSADANQIPGAACASNADCTAPQICDSNLHCMSPSFGGSSDFSDLDPIRQTCAATDQVCESGISSTAGAVNTAIAGTLGVVLPILLPDNKPLPQGTDDYPAANCGVGKFDLASTGAGGVHDKCPGGPNLLGDCFQPYILDPVTAVHHYACIAKVNAKAFATPSGLDGRAWNLPLKPDAGFGGVVGAYNIDANGRKMTASFFRIHTSTPAAGSATTCQFNDDTSQIGCLVNADPCSVGYAGREATQQTGNEALSVNAIFPTDANIVNLVSGGTPVYPLARRLYFATLAGFSHLKGGEAALASCYGDNTIVRQAMTDHNFVNLPVPGIQCLDYDETQPTTATPLPGCASATNSNACATSPPVISHPFVSSGDVQTIANTNCTVCHSGATPPQGLDLTNVNAVVGTAASECAGKLRINPGNASLSYLVDKIMGAAQDGGCFSGVRMPRGAPALSATAIATIVAWINAGATP